MSEDEERLLRAIWLSRSVANYSRPKYMKGLIERFRLRKKKGEEEEKVVEGGKNFFLYAYKIYFIRGIFLFIYSVILKR